MKSSRKSYDATDTQRWRKILAGLQGPVFVDTGIEAIALAPRALHGYAQVTILERPTRETALVRWSSSVGCHYSEQVWRKGFARRAGVCALTGMLIATGDPVFRPLRASQLCSNAGAMIEASSVEQGTNVAA
ncbi:DUF3331 domain-containing protein [Paraburkholderia sp. C35]|uniref:DUF3331 domain-containing protein n=1 Tax=Paraburkholderia sp. C35 TaxID=2126993 RepID=UPI000D69E4BD|nr:DUF3331 domain-containing protein [Paraburkholderia sp. C35]